MSETDPQSHETKKISNNATYRSSPAFSPLECPQSPPPPPHPTPVDSTGGVSRQGLVLGEALFQSLSPPAKGKRARTSSLKGLLDRNGDGGGDNGPVKNCRYALQALSLTFKPPLHYSPLTDLLERAPGVLKVILSFVVRYEDMAHGLLLSSKAFSEFKLDLLDLSFTRLRSCRHLDLPKFRDIKVLDLRATGVSDISPIRRCSNLTFIGLSATGVEDLSAVGSCSKLTTLYVMHTKVTDLSPLRNCLSLEDVNAGGTAVSDITPLALCKRLRVLNLMSSSVRDVSALASCKRLAFLDVSFTPLTAAKTLLPCPSLETFRATFSQVQDLDAMLEAEGLKELQCNAVQLGEGVAEMFRERGVALGF